MHEGTTPPHHRIGRRGDRRATSKVKVPSALPGATSEAAFYAVEQAVVGTILEGAPKAAATEVEIMNAEDVVDVVDKLRGGAIYHKVIVSLFMRLRRGEVWRCAGAISTS